jgi:NAD(P)-dependent dehydrogenase (short-subunit alcohol dehydrogenase family)
MRAAEWREADLARLNGKTVLVTGATTGIGLETAKGLATLGARVLVHGRSAERGRRSLEEIRRAVPGAEVEFIEADLASLAAVRALAAEVLSRAPRLDVLVNNAGAANVARTVTADGFETTFGVNHLAPFLLTNLLLDRLKASAPARIVNVASRAHRGGSMNFDDLNGEKDYSFIQSYGQSKLANILFTRALAKRLAGAGVTANALHPGVVRSGFGLNNRGLVRIVIGFARVFFISSEEGAKTSIYLASSPEVEGVSGEYFDKCEIIRPTREAQDDAAGERLWRVSAQMVGIV